MNSVIPYYPLLMNINSKKCLVVGGGSVALRKIEALLDCGAEVHVVSPRICSQIETLAKSGISLIRRRYQSKDLEGAVLVIAATDSQKTNHQVSSDARSQGVPVNVVDDAEFSDFILPSCFRRGALTVAVATNGKSPALARKLKEKLAAETGEEYALLVELAGQVRQELMHNGIHIAAETWNRALDIDYLTRLLREGNQAEAAAWLKYELLKNI
jgi:precorrin-2 dehydrogenase/sirohydrochlorin ferrochelatase